MTRSIELADMIPQALGLLARLVRRCTKCGQEKLREDFYKDRRTKSGLAAGCRACRGAAHMAWEARHPDRRRAHVLVANALKWGEIARPNACEQCGEVRVVMAHHEDYQAPLKVLWLCDSCHRRRHVQTAAARKNAKKGGRPPKP
jgi:hypothetical protein